MVNFIHLFYYFIRYLRSEILDYINHQNF